MSETNERTYSSLLETITFAQILKTQMFKVHRLVRSHKMFNYIPRHLPLSNRPFSLKERGFDADITEWNTHAIWRKYTKKSSSLVAVNYLMWIFLLIALLLIYNYLNKFFILKFS